MKLQTKPHSYIPPDIIASILKGFPAGATKICPEKYLRAEIEYLTDIPGLNSYVPQTKIFLFEDFSCH